MAPLPTEYTGNKLKRFDSFKRNGTKGGSSNCKIKKKMFLVTSFWYMKSNYIFLHSQLLTQSATRV